MTNVRKLPQGTAEWFHMVGSLMSAYTPIAGLAPNLNLSLVERYTDGKSLDNGLVQGIRFDLTNGQPSYRIGAGEDETGNILVEITAALARDLNLLHATDPGFAIRRDRALAGGEMRISGDIAPIAALLDLVHDPIVDRTA